MEDIIDTVNWDFVIGEEAFYSHFSPKEVVLDLAIVTPTAACNRASLTLMWLNLFAHKQSENVTLYSAHVCAAKEDRDAGGMQSRKPEPWKELRAALLDAGLENRVISELKTWLDQDPLRPVQVELTEDQVNLLGISTERPN